ncbi:MAG TPA: hypothetical protein EYG89_01740 [Bacteroidia bacterium]|nr:hypothetical protein [Bacteroidia bacterium]
MKQKIINILKDDDLLELIKKGGSALFIRILGFISGFIYIKLIVYYFGVEINGLVTLSFSVMILGSLISRLGVDINLTKFFAITGNFDNSKGILYKVLPINLIISIVIAFIVFIFSNEISVKFFDDPELSIYLKWTSPTIVLFTFLLINASVLRGLRKNNLYSFLFNGGRFFFTLLFFLSLYYLLDDKNSLISIKSHTLSIFVLFVLSLIYVIKYTKPISFVSSYKVKPFIKDSLPMLVSASVIILLGWSDTIILGIYKDTETVGVYNITLKVAMLTSFTFQALDSILAPKLSKAFHDDNMKLFKNLVKLSTKVNMVISTIIVIGLIIFRDFILNYFGPEVVAGSLTLIILSLGQLTNSICGPVGSILQMTGHQKAFQNILFLALIINIILNLLLVEKFGMIGVGFSTAFSLLFWNITSVIYIYKKLNINIFKG